MQKLEERRRKTWDHIKKIRNILSKNSTIKDRNGKDLTKQKRSRRDGKNTHNNCTKKDHKDPDNCDGVVTHPEPDILECEDKWALGSTADNKANVGDGIPAELFKNLKDNAIKVLLRWCSGKEYTHQCRRHKRHRFDFCVWKIPCSRKWQPIPVFLLGKFHRQRSLVVPGIKKSQTRLSTCTHIQVLHSIRQQVCKPSSGQRTGEGRVSP